MASSFYFSSSSKLSVSCNGVDEQDPVLNIQDEEIVGNISKM